MKKIIKEIFFNNIGLTCNFAELINYYLIIYSHSNIKFARHQLFILLVAASSGNLLAIGTFTFAAYGAYVGQRKQFDIFGIFTCAFLTAL